MDNQDTKPIVVDLILDRVNIRRFRCRLTEGQVAELRQMRGAPDAWRTHARGICLAPGRWTTAPETNSLEVLESVCEFLR